MGGRREEGGVLGHNLDMRPEPEPETEGQGSVGARRDPRQTCKVKKSVLSNTLNIE